MVSQARWTRRAVRDFSGRAWLYGEWRLGGGGGFLLRMVDGVYN